jgi:hypothetical protein
MSASAPSSTAPAVSTVLGRASIGTRGTSHRPLKPPSSGAGPGKAALAPIDLPGRVRVGMSGRRRRDRAPRPEGAARIRRSSRQIGGRDWHPDEPGASAWPRALAPHGASLRRPGSPVARRGPGGRGVGRVSLPPSTSYCQACATAETRANWLKQSRRSEPAARGSTAPPTQQHDQVMVTGCPGSRWANPTDAKRPATATPPGRRWQSLRFALLICAPPAVPRVSLPIDKRCIPGRLLGRTSCSSTMSRPSFSSMRWIRQDRLPLHSAATPARILRRLRIPSRSRV